MHPGSTPAHRSVQSPCQKRSPGRNPPNASIPAAPLHRSGVGGATNRAIRPKLREPSANLHRLHMGASFEMGTNCRAVVVSRSRSVPWSRRPGLPVGGRERDARVDRLFPRCRSHAVVVVGGAGSGDSSFVPVPLANYQNFLTVGRATCLDAHEVHPIGNLRARLVSTIPGKNVPTRHLMSIPE